MRNKRKIHTRLLKGISQEESAKKAPYLKENEETDISKVSISNTIRDLNAKLEEIISSSQQESKMFETDNENDQTMTNLGNFINFVKENQANIKSTPKRQKKYTKSQKSPKNKSKTSFSKRYSLCQKRKSQPLRNNFLKTKPENNIPKNRSLFRNYSHKVYNTKGDTRKRPRANSKSQKNSKKVKKFEPKRRFSEANVI